MPRGRYRMSLTREKVKAMRFDAPTDQNDVERTSLVKGYLTPAIGDGRVEMC